MNASTSRLSIVLGTVEQELNTCDTTKGFLRHCQAFRDQILGDEQLNNTYATWLDLTLQRRGLKPSDDQWQRLRDLAARPTGSSEEARRDRALATLSGHISWEKTKYYSFHFASRPLLESAVALTRETSFDWAAFAERINCAMLRTHIKAIDAAQSRQISMKDGRPFRNADIKAAVRTSPTTDMLANVKRWAECSDGHLWQENGQCLARRPHVQKYLVQYDAYGILVPRKNVEQIQPCDLHHHSLQSPATGPGTAESTPGDISGLSRYDPDHGLRPQVQRRSVGGKGPKLTVAPIAPLSVSPLATSPMATTTEQDGTSPRDVRHPDNHNSVVDEQTLETDTGMTDFGAHLLENDVEMRGTLENNPVWSQDSMFPWSPWLLDTDLLEQYANAVSPPNPLELASAFSGQPAPTSRHNIYPRPPVDSALIEAHALALEQCAIQFLGRSMSVWTDELRLASVSSESTGSDVITTAQHAADVWCMDEQAFSRFAQDKTFDRPVLIKESFKDAEDFSLDRCVREICDRLGEVGLSVHSPFTGNEEHITCAALVQELKQPAKAYSAHHLPPWADASKPRLTALPRYRLLNMLVERLQAQRPPTTPPKSALHDADSYRRYDTISVRGAYSGARIDSFNGAWLRNLLGKTIWMFVPRAAMTSDDWDRFKNEGVQWDPRGKARALILDVGNVLFVPPGFHIICSALTLETSWTEGGKLWDEWGIPSLLESLSWAGLIQSARKDLRACSLDEILSALYEVVMADPERFARGEDQVDFLSQFKLKLQQISRIAAT